jgi:predicted GH43/DUF377 family glycosyl hydrolase
MIATIPDLARRFDQNPLLAPSQLKPIEPGWTVECLLNPGVFRFKDRTWLMLRVAERPPQKEGFVTVGYLSPEGRIQLKAMALDDPKLKFTDPRVLRYDGGDYLTTLSHLRLLSSTDGVHFAEQPSFPPVSGAGELETFGVEDARVACVDGVYHLTYTAVSPIAVAVAMRSTSDFKTYQHRGVIFPPHNKDCALFEEKINGMYFALHRPSSPEIGGNYIWLARSPDLLHWGDHTCLFRTRPGKWDSARVGAGASPIRTDRGWLMIYHGANERSVYCLGAALLDLNDPRRVLARSDVPIMSPQADYETKGFFSNVVFTNGQVVDGDRVTMYYGASDTVVCGAHFSIAEILRSLPATGR